MSSADGPGADFWSDFSGRRRREISIFALYDYIWRTKRVAARAITPTHRIFADARYYLIRYLASNY